MRHALDGWAIARVFVLVGVASAVHAVYKQTCAVRQVMRNRLHLIVCARNGDLDEVQHLLASASKADVLSILLAGEVTWAGVTALYAAALHGHAEVVQLLLQAGAWPDLPNKVGDVPLAVAAEKGHDTVVSLLLRARAHADRLAPNSGATALHLACQNDHLQTVHTLLAGGASTDIMNADGNVTKLAGGRTRCEA